ncbi:hypothetical protein TCAL_03318 [Tigriopus californicus]|uniref:Uncharacterized protein n=1 Tax=Tigriopus californicus TaxID=6832 RepID=A0A553NPD7_TIGCA|nr:uncharacterized protein LOC131879925 [Tigriopus californicus]TRY67308.1 hypothetical protein TCAL_03318 [Tigriopus californicus]|eukprot:TCALIF_03318-PA protein Name:"Protein of unknown function" AED:0.00 eAED:0.00 QI:172/1/1/1/1/1/4/142/403
MASFNRDARALFLDRKLSRFGGSLALVTRLARRLFQKCPELWQALEQDHLERTPPAERVYVAQQFIQRTILSILDGSAPLGDASTSLGLPTKLESYLSFMDLAWVTLKSDDELRGSGPSSGGPRIQWHVFVLRDHAPPVEFLFHKMRRRLKQKLPESRLSSVQVDQDFGEGQAEPRRIFFRVTSVKKTRSLKKDEEHLLKKPAIFFAYYPSEPYFYCDKPIFDEFLGEALSECLFSSGFDPLPLSGPHLDSLRQLRLHRDGKLPPVNVGRRPLYNAPNPFNILATEPNETEEELEFASTSLPALSRLTLKGSSKFTESKAIQDFHNGRLPLQMKNLDFEMVASGPDVLKGLNTMINSCRVSYFGPLLPKWVQEVGNRGRNVIHINEKENGDTGNSTATQNSKK